MDIGSYWGLFVVAGAIALFVGCRHFLRRRKPNDRYKVLEHSNARPAVEYDSTAFIQNGGMDQYPTESGPVFPNRLSVEFDTKRR